MKRRKLMASVRSVVFRAVLLLMIGTSICEGAFAQAQAASADLKGTILDPSKAGVVGATGTASNVNTGVTRSTVSDQSGEYRLALLQPGEYDVRVEMTGFATQRRRGIILTVGQTVVINFDLQLGSVTNEV